MKVLIVEDDEAIQALLKLRISDEGHAVIAVDDAETALRVFVPPG